jgi:hypothetical protein
LGPARHDEPADVVPAGDLEAVVDGRLREARALRVERLVVPQEDRDGARRLVADREQERIARDAVALEAEAPDQVGAAGGRGHQDPASVTRCAPVGTSWHTPRQLPDREQSLRVEAWDLGRLERVTRLEDARAGCRGRGFEERGLKEPRRLAGGDRAEHGRDGDGSEDPGAAVLVVESNA